MTKPATPQTRLDHEKAKVAEFNAVMEETKEALEAMREKRNAK